MGECSKKYFQYNIQEKRLTKYRLSFFVCVLLLACIVFGVAFNIHSAKGNALQYRSGASSIAMEQSSGRVLYGTNIHTKLPMASTTKVLTALVVLEQHEDIAKKVKIPSKAVGIEGSSIYLRANEEMTIEDLLFGLMLMSGNDTAVALAIITSGSVEKFSILMNQKAKEIGANNSNFTNPHGLHEKEHYTTAYDLGLITCHAMNNADFKRISSSTKHTIPDTGSGQGVRNMHNKNKMLRMYEGADGVKTGFTKAAGRCLVSSATRDDMQVVTVVLNHGDMWNDSIHLLNQSFKNYKMTKILGEEQSMLVEVKGGTKYSVVVAPRDIYYPVKEGESISYSYQLENLTAPVKKAVAHGKIQISLDNRLLFEEKLYTMDSVKKKSFIDYFTGR